MSVNRQTRNRKPRKPRSDLRRLGRQFMSSLLRSLFLLNSPKRSNQAGFVLPTTVLLLLIVSLTVGAMSFRTFSRTSQTIAYRDQQIVDSLAAPAIDRAKAKVEFLFTKDPSVADKRPPSSGDLLNALSAPTSGGPDTYTFPGDTTAGGETRVDLDPSTPGTIDGNAWSFEASDGTTVVYSITMDDANDDSGSLVSIDGDVSDQEKADNFVVRNGPIDTTVPTGSCPVARLAGNGWQLSGAQLAKNIQVDVLSIRGEGPTRTVSAAEYQQTRTAARGNRWGAWWRYDIEISPGRPLRWNGAMHTEGSLLTGKKFIAYMVSAPESCIYNDADASVIEVSGQVEQDGDQPEFLGQVVSGVLSKRAADNPFFDEGSFFHTDATARDTSYNNAGEKLGDGSRGGTRKHSINEDNGDNNTAPDDVAQDPIKIFTQDIFAHNDDTTWSRRTDWEDPDVKPSRVENDNTGAVRPFLDDGYRADNRYGPKPVYNSKHSFKEINDVEISTPHKSGDKIDDNPALTNDVPDTEEYGLDGYWERNAADSGLRIIVGQRLELGNAFGWRQDEDPLYPPNDQFRKPRNTAGMDLKGRTEMLQMRSLRDNLAAVQSMAVYHAADSGTNGNYPLACLASTVHPGTQETLENSRTFSQYSDGTWKTDFLTGHGTNGMEFAPPASSNFGNTWGSISPQWLRPLRNLTYFAGDPKGGAPSFPAVQEKEDNASDDDVIHPYPYMSMWGDYSILRRIFEDYSSGESLSLADRSTIHTAACTIGMLAHNINAVKAEADATLMSTDINWSQLGVKISGIVKPNNVSNGNPIIGRPLPTLADGVTPNPAYKSPGLCKATQATPPDYTDPNWTGCPSQNPNDVTDVNDEEYPLNYLANFSTDEWLVALEGDGVLNAAQVERIRGLSEYSQILRDRTLGFKQGAATEDLSGNFDPLTNIWTNPSSGPDSVTAGQIDPGDTFPASCDPRLFATNSSGVNSAVNSARSRMGLALVVCSSDIQPKYPALYYIFPKVDHSQLGAAEHTQPPTEEFIVASNKYITDTAINGTSNVYEEVTDADIASIALTPRDPSNWELPKVNVTPSTTPSTGTPFDFTEATTSSINYSGSAVNAPSSTAKNLSQNIVRLVNNSGVATYYRTALLDKAMMDGREQINNRILDLDIDLLTDNNVSGSIAWIPQTTGVVYAFREDAIREDAIVRPYADTLGDADAAWNTCSDMTELTTNISCYMVLNPGERDDSWTTENETNLESHDPPLNSDTGISPKPVDMYADPDRRPYGFRLINGESLHRTAADSNDPVAGMTFVTDNTVYIKGDFNLHADKTQSNLEGNLLEEFSDYKLGTEFASYDEGDEKDARRLFYRRQVLDERFADPSQDNWRPVEIFADSITILSDLYIDGWIEDGFTTRSTTDRGRPRKASSYLNFNRPWFVGTNSQDPYEAIGRWRREDRTDDTDVTPIEIDRNGNSYRKIADGSGDFVEFPRLSGGALLSFYRRVNPATNQNSNSGRPYYEVRQSQQPSPSDPDPVRINALLIGGIIPSRAGQSNGGFYNFPRLLEFWPNRELIISGGFFQLNFSSQAVGQFDQDSWEPGMPAESASNNQQFISRNGVDTGSQRFNGFYYGAANRIWGYDVGFQYTPAAPIARRFVRLDRPRSEYYRELPVDDPYIDQLCTAIAGGCS